MASRSWNRIELIGNLTRDPELRYTPNGAAVATFGLATNRSYLVEGERKEEVDFHKVVAWNKLAELCSQLLKKGTKAFISGRLQYREWEGQDQVKRREAEIVLEDMLILTPKGESSGPSESAAEVSLKEASTPKPEKAKKVEEVEEAPPVANEKVSDDDLPF
ncbi:MAG: single-stranded DNA-binding protein [Candidatus Daviesbacteria bacterium]|nr:single-stranded DNA-binding protein [Candidatus Daviesbacteria bacterium]